MTPRRMLLRTSPVAFVHRSESAPFPSFAPTLLYNSSKVESLTSRPRVFWKAAPFSGDWHQQIAHVGGGGVYRAVRQFDGEQVASRHG